MIARAGCRVVALLTLAVALAGSDALAQSGSERPLKIVVGYAPGGPADALARISAQILSDALGQPVVVENRPGAGGSIAAAMVAKAPADGSTLLLAATSDVIHSLIDREAQRTVSFTGVRGISEQDAYIQDSQGLIADRTVEHLGTTDIAIIEWRKLMLRLARDLREGQEPPQARRPEAYWVRSGGAVAPSSATFEEVAAPRTVIQ